MASELRDERLFESVQDTIRFEKLLETAEQLCLRQPPQYPEYTPPENTEADVVARLGVLGYRYAIELIEGEDNGYKPFDESLPHPLRQPELFTGPLNRRLLAKATAFGEAFIDESYDVLGPDVDSWVEEFKNANDDAGQTAVIDKLSERLVELSSSERGLDEAESTNGAYQSVLLSPKVIGTYPDFNLPPTCLGVASIGAGFFKKAGVTTMHMGVMETDLQSEYVDLITLIELATSPDVQDVIGTTLPQDIVERLKAKVDDLWSVILADPGTHSALLVKLSSGAWCQFDPSLGLSTLTRLSYNSDESKDDKVLDQAHKNLIEAKEVAPGLELSVTIPRGRLEYYWPAYLRAIGELEDAMIDKALAASDGSVTESIRQLVVDDHILCESEDEIVVGIQKDYLKDIMHGPADDEASELTLHFVAREAIASFILEDMPEAEWRQACEIDDDFRQRMHQRIKCLPLLIGIMYGDQIAGDVSLYPFHNRMELGLPETSIGLAVLHNIGLDMADDISTHHWLSQWPSHIVPPDTMHRASRSSLQKEVMRRHLGRLTRQWNVAFSHTYVKMIESYEDNGRDLANVT